MDWIFHGATAIVGQTGPVGHLGPLPVYLFGVTTAAGVLVGVAAGLLQAERFGLSLSKTFEVAVWSVIAGAVGARLGYVAVHWADYRRAVGSILSFSEGGFLFHGALLGGLVALLAYGLVGDVDGWRTLDAFAPGLALGQAVGLIGAQVLGEATSMPWGVTVQGTVIHPLPAYGIVAAYGLFYVLWRLGGGRVRPGSLFLTYLLLHGIGSVFLGLWSPSKMFLGLTASQWGGGAAAAIALAAMYSRQDEPLLQSEPAYVRRPQDVGARLTMGALWVMGLLVLMAGFIARLR